MRQSRSFVEHLALLDARQAVENDSDTASEGEDAADSDSDSEFGDEPPVGQAAAGAPTAVPSVVPAAKAPKKPISFSSRPLVVALKPEDVNERLGGISPSIRTLTAISPSQANATAVAVAAQSVVFSNPPQPTTLQTVAAPPALSRKPQLPSIELAESQPTISLKAAPAISTGVAPEATGKVEAPLTSFLPEEEVVGEGAVAEGVTGMEGKEGVGALPGLDEKASEVPPPENNQGAAIGITLGVIALMAILLFAGFVFMKRKKQKQKNDDSIFDWPLPPSTIRSTIPPPPPSKAYVDEKVPDQGMYPTYADLVQENSNAGFRQSISRWIQDTTSWFSQPTTEGGIISVYRQEDPIPPSPSFVEQDREIR